MTAVSCMSFDLPDDPDMRQTRDLYVVLSFLDELAMAKTPAVSLSDLVAFLCGNLSLSATQQEYVLSNERLLAEFQSLIRDFAVARPGHNARSAEAKARECDEVSSTEAFA